MGIVKNGFRLSKRRFVILAILFLSAGTATSIWLAFAEDARMRSNLLIQGRIIAAAFDPALVEELSGTADDTEKASYRALKSRLILMRGANPLCRFIYLARRTPAGEIIFLVDAEPEASVDYSAPGDVYAEASELFKTIFISAQAVVEGPLRDRWGDWVSALVPIPDHTTQMITAVLGVDVNARDWHLNIILRTAPAVTMTLLLLALLTFFYLLFQRAETARLRIAQSERRLRESERDYRSVVLNMLDIFYRLDAEGKIKIISPSASRLLGYDHGDELIGKSVKLFLDPDAFDSAFAELRASGAIRDREVMVSCKDGTQIPMAFSMHALKDASGRITGYEGIARDISDRKSAENREKEMEKQIQRAQKMEAIGALAGGVAHDLNNILSGIVSYPDLILTGLSRDDPLRKPLETIRDSGLKAGAIVQDLLTLARRGVPVAEVVNLNRLILEYLESPECHKLRSFHPTVAIETRLQEGLFNLLGSPIHLTKTIMNLVSNAAEAMPEGGRITLSTGNRYVDFQIRGYDQVVEGEYVALTVADTGIGIAPQDQTRIFEPFFSKKRLGRSGTGLGMAVVWGTVKDHKGYIDMQSVPNGGTVFTLYFPATRNRSGSTEISISIDQYRGNGETILVVDDVAQQREIATAILEQYGYAVRSVASGEAAVSFLRHHGADLVILDMIMAPGQDGLDTYRQILEHRPDQIAIITSGYSETARVREAQRLGAGRYIKKPYSTLDLLQAVKEALHAREVGPGEPPVPEQLCN